MNYRLLANLRTCLLANLLTILTMLFHAHSVPSSSYPRPVGRYERRGGFFSHQLVSFAEFVFPNIPRRFPKLILSDISPSVCNEIFFYLTVAMLNAKNNVT